MRPAIGNGVDPPRATRHHAILMKLRFALLLSLLVCACEPIQRGPTGGGPSGEVMRPGQFVRTMIDNASFFRHRPLQAGSADLLLQRHTPMRLIQTDPVYSKVELDNGQVGFVQTATLELIPREPAPDQPDQPVEPDPIPPPDQTQPDPLSPIPPTLDPVAVPLPPQ